MSVLCSPNHLSLISSSTGQKKAVVLVNGEDRRGNVLGRGRLRLCCDGNPEMCCRILISRSWSHIAGELLVNMDSFTSINISVVLFLGVGLGLLVLQLWRTWFRLRHIPGPFPASITNFQRMGWIGTKRAHLILQEVHEKYGEVARIGPKTVSFSNPEAIPTVYPMRPGFPKVRTLFPAQLGLTRPTVI